jgi:hypothetical protein
MLGTSASVPVPVQCCHASSACNSASSLPNGSSADFVARSYMSPLSGCVAKLLPETSVLPEVLPLLGLSSSNSRRKHDLRDGAHAHTIASLLSAMPATKMLKPSQVLSRALLWIRVR